MNWPTELPEAGLDPSVSGLEVEIPPPTQTPKSATSFSFKRDSAGSIGSHFNYEEMRPDDDKGTGTVVRAFRVFEAVKINRAVSA